MTNGYNPMDTRWQSSNGEQSGYPTAPGEGHSPPRRQAPPPPRPGLDTTSTMIFGAIEDFDADSGYEAEQSRLVAGLPPGSALLVVRRGPNAGSRFLLDTQVTAAGRHPDSDIFLDDVTVSRRHAEFLRDGGIYTVRDVGSLNGTYLNRERVESAILSHGDEVQIGKFRLMFLVVPARVPAGEAR